MSTLVLRLAGPLQSWGAASRFTRRTTEAQPTKSGIIGLLAAAQGLRRTDPIEHLVGIELAVRTDQDGVLLRDFQTAHHRVSGKPMPLTERFYWTDAVYTAHIGGPRPLLEGLADSLRDPAYPLYLGRRSCVPEGRVVIGVDDRTVADSLRLCPWQAGNVRRARALRQRQPWLRLAVQADSSVFPDLPATHEVNDVPVTFDPECRVYQSRLVVTTSVEIATGFQPAGDTSDAHDPMALLGGAS